MERQSVSQDNESHNELLKICCLGILFIGLLVSVVVYLVFSIVFLIEDYNISNECKGSNLWEYVLVSTILMFPSASVKTDKYNILAIIVVIIGVLNLCMSIWGGIELWDYSCHDLAETNLWKIGLASFILQVSIASLCIMVPPILLCYFYTKEDRAEPNPLKIDTNV